MNLKRDTETFESLQTGLITEIVRTTMVKLVETGLEGRQLEEATAAVAFSVASILDDTTTIDADGLEVHPYLTFRTGDDELTHCGENAYSYDDVRGILKDLFDV